MTARMTLAAALVALGLGFGWAEPADAKPCSGRSTHAVLSSGHKCLAAGQFCKRAADADYHRYGFHCHTRDAGGRYRLTR